MDGAFWFPAVPVPGAEGQRGREVADQLPEGGCLLPPVEYDG